eukprot:GHVT01087461.1.p1 GENE.GHVT01087461.1~~GHVT01087461.1.p1  ORF type:complete len:305 (-),score=32.35 GHVT01087461.1:1810-2724(-)
MSNWRSATPNEGCCRFFRDNRGSMLSLRNPATAGGTSLAAVANPQLSSNGQSLSSGGCVTNGKVHLPGDLLSRSVSAGAGGAAGLEEDERQLQVEAGKPDAVRSLCGGVAVKNPTFPYGWVLANDAKRYIPRVGDLVIAVVTQRNAELYRTDINSVWDASLPSVEAFEGATKRNRPNLQLGSWVYCRVTSSNRDYETELTCLTPGKTKAWNTPETSLGQLSGGCLLQMPIAVTRSLVGDRCYVLERLGEKFPFETAVGLNGRVWIRAGSVADTFAIAQILEAMPGKTLAQLEVLISMALEKRAR